MTAAKPRLPRTARALLMATLLSLGTLALAAPAQAAASTVAVGLDGVLRIQGDGAVDHLSVGRRNVPVGATRSWWWPTTYGATRLAPAPAAKPTQAPAIPRCSPTATRPR